jgi:dipeptide/tripeptide permease
MMESATGRLLVRLIFPISLSAKIQLMTDMQSEVKKTGMPAAVPYIIGNEAAERFSFYGIRAIMTTFLVAQFFNPTQNPELQAVAEAKSNELSHLFVTLAYFMPLVGGILADWFLGKYRVILYVSMLYAAGNLMVALNTENLSLFSLGLIMIAVAAGGIKSCVSANVGDQFDKSNEHLLSKMYGWFYFTINTGSIVATAIIPLIYKQYGAKIAFGIPGILMVVATVIFWLGRDKYVRVPPSGYKRENFMTITGAAIWERLLSIFQKKPVAAEIGNTFWVELGKKYQFSESAIDGVQAVYRILMVFAFTPIFWALWDQNLSEWVLQAAKLDRNLFGYELLTEQVQTFNPIFLVGMIPVFRDNVALRAGRHRQGPDGCSRRKIHLLHQCYAKLLDGRNSLTERVKILQWADGLWRRSYIFMAALLGDQPEADAFCCDGSQTCKLCKCPKKSLCNTTHRYPLRNASQEQQAVYKLADGNGSIGSKLFERNTRADVVWKKQRACTNYRYEVSRKKIGMKHLLQNAFWGKRHFDVQLQVCIDTYLYVFVRIQLYLFLNLYELVCIVMF